MKFLPVGKCLYGYAIILLLLVGVACDLPDSANAAGRFANNPLSINGSLGEISDVEKGEMAKNSSQAGDFFFQQSHQLVNIGSQPKKYSSPKARATPTPKYPWDTTIILQGGATARAGNAPVMSIPVPATAVPTNPFMAPTPQETLIQPTVIKPSLTSPAAGWKLSSSASLRNLFSAFSRLLRGNKHPKPTRAVPTLTAMLPIAITFTPTMMRSSSTQPTSITLTATSAPTQLLPTQQPATATLLLPTSTSLLATATLILPSPTQLPATPTPMPTQPPATATLLPPTPIQPSATATLLLPTPIQPSATSTPLPPTPTDVLPTSTHTTSPVNDNFYWSTSFDTGNLSELEANSYGGFVNQGNGTYNLVNSPAYSGTYAAALTIDTSQSSPTGAHAAYMFFWKELPGDAYYYSAWYYIPSGTVPDEWWNIWQWKSTYDGNSNNSQRIFSIGARQLNNGLALYLVQRLPDGGKVNHNSAYNIPLDQWFHIEGYYRQAFDTTGQVIVWQDGVEVFNISNAQTVLNDLTVDWSVNNYSNLISPSPCTIFVDDIAVSSSRIGH